MKKDNKGILHPLKKGKGGVFAPHHKNTQDMAVIRIPTPERVVIPMEQNIGVPCTPVVKVGDTVSVGQLIGDSDKFVSAPVHASISGTVKSVKEIKYLGKNVMAVEIESDGEMRLCDSLKPPKIETKEEFLAAVRASGLVGLGGAGFPTHVKLNVPADKKIDTLLINAAECEPYITVDYRECLDNSWDIMSGIHIVKDMLGIKNVIICAEDNKPQAFEVLKAISENSADVDDDIKIMALPSKYPQGAEKVLIEAATGRRVPMGKLPADVGVIVMNVASIAFLARYIKSGKPLVSRSLTIDGDAVKSPKNVRVPIGTSVKDIIEFCGGYNEPAGKLLFGGPMMGIAFDDDSLPITKRNNAVLAFTEKSVQLNTNTPCIRCARCVDACPMSLMPTKIEKAAKIADVDALKKFGVNVCIECGSCAFSCPAQRPLVQYMRNAKEVLRREG